MKQSFIYFFFVCITLTTCGQTSNNTPLVAQQNHADDFRSMDETGTTVVTRFIPPKGFQRVAVEAPSFANYLRHLPLKPTGTKVRYYNGTLKQTEVYDAVVDMEISNKDLQQCADAVMRLRGEYLYAMQAYDQISFALTNGFQMDYSEWIKGNRIVVKGNKTTWSQQAKPSNTYKDFRNYMEFVFMYAGTISLSKSLQSKSIQDIAIGDVFIIGGSPGHAVIVVDVVENEAGKKMVLLAQSYMPAQEIQVLKNLNDPQLSPWYSVEDETEIVTPEWIFEIDQLKTWQ